MNEQSTCAWVGLDELQPLVRSYLRPRLYDENDVEDVVQEALLRAARFRRVEREPQSLRAWMLRIAENALTDHRRRKRRRRTQEVDDELLDKLEGREAAPGETFDDERVRVDDRVVERRQLLGWMADALSELDGDDQFVLDSFYAGAEACPAIAESLEVDPALVKTRLFRARERLREHVKRCLVHGNGPAREPHAAPATCSAMTRASAGEIHGAGARGFRAESETRVRRACAAEGRSR